jgi:hypothetical protein
MATQKYEFNIANGVVDEEKREPGNLFPVFLEKEKITLEINVEPGEESRPRIVSSTDLGHRALLTAVELGLAA